GDHLDRVSHRSRLHPTPNPSPSSCRRRVFDTTGGESGRRVIANVAFLVSALFGFAAVATLAFWPSAEPARAQSSRDDLAALKAKFARPTFVPNPADNLPTAAKVALGKRLFEDRELSATGTVACSSCHDPKLPFTDG